jgi:hypothetical protein
MLRLEGLTEGVTAVPATNVEPPGTPGRISLEVRGHQAFATQLRLAHRMLARAHALGTPLRFSWSPGGRTDAREKDVLVDAFRRAGFAPRAVRGGSRVPVDLRTRTWCGAWPQGSAWLEPLFESSSATNVEHLADRYVDRRIAQVRRFPLNNQAPGWNRLDVDVLRSLQPVIPLWYSGVAMAHGSAVQGMADDITTGMPTWAHLWVKQ